MYPRGRVQVRARISRALVHEALQHLPVAICAQGQRAVSKGARMRDVQAMGMRSPISAMTVLNGVVNGARACDIRWLTV